MYLWCFSLCNSQISLKRSRAEPIIFTLYLWYFSEWLSSEHITSLSTSHISLLRPYVVHYSISYTCLTLYHISLRRPIWPICFTSYPSGDHPHGATKDPDAGCWQGCCSTQGFELKIFDWKTQSFELKTQIWKKNSRFALKMENLKKKKPRFCLKMEKLKNLRLCS